MHMSTTSYQLEEPRLFAQSSLWKLQRRYFAERGADAWIQGDVPHYVTSNPVVANSYAHIIVACWRDYLRLVPDALAEEEPFYLCELGAGSGRLAFHLLQQLLRLCAAMQLPAIPFRYVLTDSSSSLLEFWDRHPYFQPFFASGLLDYAHFDVEQSTSLHLQRSGKTLDVGSLRHPLIVIANYVFDSVPQDLYCMQEQGCFAGLISLSVEQDPETLTVAEVLETLQVDYTYQPLSAAPYQDPLLNELLADYQRTLHETHLLFPATGLHCLQRLRTLSTHGALVLSADKGDHRLQVLDNQAAPELVRHGSFSLLVNYHAFHAFCERSNGQALFPTHPHEHINVGGFLLLNRQEEYIATRSAYQQYIQMYGPDDFYTISVHARQRVLAMTCAEMLSYVRLSCYDSHLFACYLPRLLSLAAELGQAERQAVSEVVRLVWQNYFPLEQTAYEEMRAQYVRLLQLLEGPGDGGVSDGVAPPQVVSATDHTT